MTPQFKERSLSAGLLRRLVLVWLSSLTADFSGEMDQTFRTFHAFGPTDMIQCKIQFLGAGRCDLHQQVKPPRRCMDSHDITERFQSLQHLCRGAGLNRDQRSGAQGRASCRAQAQSISRNDASGLQPVNARLTVVRAMPSCLPKRATEVRAFVLNAPIRA